MYNWVQETGTNRYVLFIDDMIAGTLYYDKGDDIHKFFAANLIQPSPSVPVYYIEGKRLEEVKKNTIIELKIIIESRIKTYKDFIKECQDTLNKLNTGIIQ